MGHAKVLSPTEQVIENILEHVTVNSWMNVVNWDNWVFGITDDADAAHQWHRNNSRPSPRYYAAFDCADNDTARKVLTHFRELGVPDSDNYPADAGSATMVYAYKTFI